MRIVPTGFSGVTKPQAQQKTFQAIAGPPLIVDSGCAGANQVANGFIFLIRHVDRREFPSAVKAGQLIGIPPVGEQAIGHRASLATARPLIPAHLPGTVGAKRAAPSDGVRFKPVAPRVSGPEGYQMAQLRFINMVAERAHVPEDQAVD